MNKPEMVYGKWYIQANATESKSAQIAEKHKKADRPIEDIIPHEFHDYLDVFSETAAATLPEHKSS